MTIQNNTAVAGACASSGACNFFKSSMDKVVSPIFDGSFCKSYGSNGIRGTVSWIRTNPLSFVLPILITALSILAVIKLVKVAKSFCAEKAPVTTPETDTEEPTEA